MPFFGIGPYGSPALAYAVSGVYHHRKFLFFKWIKQDALFCAISAENMEHFIFLPEKLGFEVKQGKYIAVKVPGMKRFKRLDTISEDLCRESLEAMFRYGDASLAEDELEYRIPVGDMEYFAGIKLFNKVIDRLGVDMNQQKRYEVFDHIYEAGMREKKGEQNRNSR